MCACPQEHVAAQKEKNVTGKSLKKVHKLHSLVSSVAALRCPVAVGFPRTGFCAINGSGASYFSELLYVYTPSRTLRSSSDPRTLEIQQYCTKCVRGFIFRSHFLPWAYWGAGIAH